MYLINEYNIKKEFNYLGNKHAFFLVGWTDFYSKEKLAIRLHSRIIDYQCRIMTTSKVPPVQFQEFR